MSNSNFKYYAVRKGRQPGIYRTWDECSAQVNGYAGAVYKGFKSLEEAQAFLNRGAPEKIGPPSPPRAVEHRAQVVVYTDGAALGNPGSGGYGIVMLNAHHRKEFKGGFRLTTNNRMEMTAAIVALRMLTTRVSVTLYTDSRYLVNSMTKGWVESWRKRGWKKWDKTDAANSDLWEELLGECDKHQVTFEWVRGHHGNIENERCDELSKEMAMKDDLPADTGYESRLSPQRLKQLLGKKYRPGI